MAWNMPKCPYIQHKLSGDLKKDHQYINCLYFAVLPFAASPFSSPEPKAQGELLRLLGVCRMLCVINNFFKSQQPINYWLYYDQAFCLLFLLFSESVIVLCFVVRYFMSILVLQSSWWGRESWLLCLNCLPGVSWWLCGSSLRCHGFDYGLRLWYFLIILTY